MNAQVTAQTDTRPVDEVTLVQLASDLANAQADLEKAQRRVDEAKAAIRSTLPGPDSYAAGDATIVVAPNTRFDQTLALKAIPAELLPLVSREETKVVVDRTRVEVLLPQLLDACTARYEDKVQLK